MPLNIARLRSVSRGLPAAVDRGVFRTAQEVYEDADANVPVDTGDLRASGRIEPDAPDGSASYQVVYGGGAVDYARWVEEGNDNPNYPAQPYLGPARKRAKLRQNVQAEIRRLLRGAS